MSTIVCQNLVPCFESQINETTTTTTTLKLKVTPPPAKSLDFGNWGLFQTAPKDDKNSNFYTHPLDKKSSFSRLSAKSLELCTESLGSESGCDIFSTYPIENSSSHIEKSKQVTNFQKRTPQETETKKVKNFPPPLTSMSGSSNLQVVRHREGGRLIIEAVEAPFRNTYLQAERSEGRLRLCFLTGDRTEQETEQETEQKTEQKTEQEEYEDEDENDEEETEMADDEFEGEMNLEMEMEMEMGIENFKRMSRCNGNEGLCRNWNPTFWVATS